ncbi:hypothetical protein SKAU_G00045520 [Synaphobranchus kaupii]|uniref:Uncharacterized protein n=1 Tax=Synaphobranchus kaupii TaxID=118154 RepID=A0A9Q1G202_SYNKA|nr:hypothetical protein SKAU_G00045520 [Synaphobranchus kaupii]
MAGKLKPAIQDLFFSTVSTAWSSEVKRVLLVPVKGTAFRLEAQACQNLSAASPERGFISVNPERVSYNCCLPVCASVGISTDGNST